MIPQSGRSTSGGGLRAWGLGEALRARGHDVVYSVPRQLVPDGDEYDELRELAFEPTDLQSSLLRAAPDVLLVEQWGLATHLTDTSLPVVLDLHGSLILENAFRQHRSLTSNAAAKIKALQKADMVICPATRQRAYFMPWLMMSGADPVELPVSVVPVSMPPDLPQRTADYEGPLTLVYGGQLWPWIHPGLALKQATRVLEDTGAGTLNLFVNEPEQQEILPYDNSTRIPAWTLPDQVKNSDVVKLEGMIPRDSMIARYASAHLAVDVYGWNTERELAFTTRTVEYLWCGLPVLYGNYGELAGLIDRYEAGWLVDPGDVEGVRAAILEAVTDRAELKRRSDNARRLVQEELLWDRTIDPLDAFVKEPIIRDKGQTIYGKLALEFDRIKHEATDRVTQLELDLKNLVEEVSNRDARIVSLTDELSRRERIFEEEVERNRNQVGTVDTERRRMDDMLRESQIQLERQGVEVSEREREIRQLSAKLEQAHQSAEALQGELEQAQDLLGCEQSDHGQTTANYTKVRAELGTACRELEEKEAAITGLQADIKGAVAKIAQQTAATQASQEGLEQQVKQLTDGELAMRQDVAAEAGRAEQMMGERDAMCEQNKALRQQLEQLQQNMMELRNSWIERSVATGQHSFKRVAVQIPALAGLFVRNLANNAYMTVWQKRHNVRIFPGQ